MKQFVRTLAREVRRLVNVATYAEGNLKGTRERFRCLIIERSKPASDLLSRTFDGRPEILSRRLLWMPSLKRLAGNPPPHLDLCVARLSPWHQASLRGLYDFSGPILVKQVLRLDSWDAVRARFHRTKRSFVSQLEKKREFSVRISTDAKDLELFYHRMLLPHARGQFASHASVDTYGTLQLSFKSGFLVVVERDRETVAAALCAIEGRTLTVRRSGVLDGDRRLIRAGAQAALRYFEIRLACERSLETVNLLHSEPFLNDGVYVTKREWGAAACLDAKLDAEGIYAYFLPRASVAAARYFEINPTIVALGAQLQALVGMPEDGPPREVKLKALAEAYRAPGLAGLLVLTPGSKAPLALPFPPEPTNAGFDPSPGAR